MGLGTWAWRGAGKFSTRDMGPETWDEDQGHGTRDLGVEGAGESLEPNCKGRFTACDRPTSYQIVTLCDPFPLKC